MSQIILYSLIKTDTYQVPKDQQKPEIVFEGTYMECIGKFQGMCSYSFSNHKKYSYTHYDIKPKF